MKSVVAIALLSIISMPAFANSEVLSDISKIGSTGKVISFIDKNRLSAKSIEYKMTSYCTGGPSNYLIKAANEDGKICEVWVQVGDCNGDFERTKVSLLTSAANIDCK